MAGVGRGDVEGEINIGIRTFFVIEISWEDLVIRGWVDFSYFNEVFCEGVFGFRVFRVFKVFFNFG